MTFGKIVVFALIVAAAVYIFEIVSVRRKMKQEAERIEVAKRNGWRITARATKTYKKDEAKGKDFEENRHRWYWVTIYEFELKGKKRHIKLSSRDTLPYEKEFYYDAEQNNKILNDNAKYLSDIMLLVPVIVFVGIILVLRKIFNV